MGIVTNCASVGKIRSGDVFSVTNVQFYSVKSARFDRVYEPYRTRDPFNDAPEPENPTAELRRYLSCGRFYFSYTRDLTRNTQSIASEPPGLRNETSWRTYDPSFVWNRVLLRDLLRLKDQYAETTRAMIEKDQLFLLLIQGFVESREISLAGRTICVALISRTSCERAGTRFNVRGLDDDGHVANSVETEQLLTIDLWPCFSFVQVRGSAPLFWEQPGVQVGTPKIEFSRGVDSTLPASERHFRDLTARYGGVLVINLLSPVRPGEDALIAAFTNIVGRINFPELRYVAFDFNSHCRGGDMSNLSMLYRQIGGLLEQFGYLMIDAATTNTQLIMRQSGVVRTNCLDCLDRYGRPSTLRGMCVNNSVAQDERRAGLHWASNTRSAV